VVACLLKSRHPRTVHSEFKVQMEGVTHCGSSPSTHLIGSTSDLRFADAKRCAIHPWLEGRKKGLGFGLDNFPVLKLHF
jgi:hypothetical protein